jgi:hypothetical protein
VLEVGSRARDLPAPVIAEGGSGAQVVWSSLWSSRPDARIRFDLTASSGTYLRWTLLVDEPAPDASKLGHMRKRLNVLINANLRYSFGQ